MSAVVKPEVWTIQKMLQWTSGHFQSKNIESARLDAELLLAKTLSCKRLDLYLRFDQPLKPEELKVFKEFVLRRAQREPVAYILGLKEFYSRDFEVGPGVLIPRPETEHLVDFALAEIKEGKKERHDVLDIGCGSGILGITLAAEVPQAYAWALDSSERACSITTSNIQKHNVSERVQCLLGDFLSYDFKRTFDLVVSNPPYIGRVEEKSLQSDVISFEPQSALFGGDKGHEILEQWIPKMVELLNPGGLLLCEIGFDQSTIVKDMATQTLELIEIEVHKDFSNNPRVLKARRKKA